MEHRNPDEPGRVLSSDETGISSGATLDPAIENPPDSPPPSDFDPPTWTGWVDWSGE